MSRIYVPVRTATRMISFLFGTVRYGTVPHSTQMTEIMIQINEDQLSTGTPVFVMAMCTDIRYYYVTVLRPPEFSITLVYYGKIIYSAVPYRTGTVQYRNRLCYFEIFVR